MKMVFYLSGWAPFTSGGTSALCPLLQISKVTSRGVAALTKLQPCCVVWGGTPKTALVRERHTLIFAECCSGGFVSPGSPVKSGLCLKCVVHLRDSHCSWKTSPLICNPCRIISCRVIAMHVLVVLIGDKCQWTWPPALHTILPCVIGADIAT